MRKKKHPPPCIATKTKPKTHRFWWRVWRDPDPQGPIIGPPPQWECGGLLLAGCWPYVSSRKIISVSDNNSDETQPRRYFFKSLGR